jgi:hypothetical protein
MIVGSGTIFLKTARAVFKIHLTTHKSYHGTAMVASSFIDKPRVSLKASTYLSLYPALSWTTGTNGVDANASACHTVCQYVLVSLYQQHCVCCFENTTIIHQHTASSRKVRAKQSPAQNAAACRDLLGTHSLYLLLRISRAEVESHSRMSH